MIDIARVHRLAVDRRLEAIRKRLVVLRLEMAARGPADERTDLTAEHRDLVRERNALIKERTRRA